MARVASLVIGLVLLALGVWGVVAWWGAVLVLLKAVVAVALVLLGVGVFIFGLSELWAGEPRRATPPSAGAVPDGHGEPA